MKVLDNVKERRKILDLKVKCMNEMDPRVRCNWTGELRVYKVASVSVGVCIHVKYFFVCLSFCVYLHAYR